MTRSLQRRTVLKLGAAAAAVSPGILAGCAKVKSTNTGAAASADVKLPTYVPFDGPRPDLAGTTQGIQPGYKSFPKKLVQSVKATPGDGSKVTALTEIWETPPPPMGKNAYWQEMNKKLGVTLNLIMGTDPGYPDKFAAIVAGGDLPDLMWIPPNQGITHVADLLTAKFTDLTSLLSGDAIKEYPNLAALQPSAWKTAVVDGKIWGAPIPQGVFGQIYVGNNKVWDPVGGFQCKNADEFMRKCKELTRPKQNKWALEPYYANAVHMFGQWFGAPNGWRQNKDGTLTNRFETEEYEAAVAYAIKLRKAGYFYPDPNITDSHTPYLQGKIAAVVQSGPGAIGARSKDRVADPTVKDELLIPFGHSGGPGVHDLGYGSIGYTAIKKTDEKRVRMLLRVFDYLAAPFGSSEWLFLNYGTKGEHFTYDPHGAPAYTKKGSLEVIGVESGVSTMCHSSEYVYDAQYPDDVDYLFGIQKGLLKVAQADPTIGHYSDTYTKVGGKLTNDVYDTVTDIVAGRDPISALKQAVNRWKSGGGEAMRKEYEKSIGKHH